MSSGSSWEQLIAQPSTRWVVGDVWCVVSDGGDGVWCVVYGGVGIVVVVICWWWDGVGMVVVV